MWATHILQSAGGCFSNITLAHGLPLSLFLAGLIGGGTHCAVMCGPFVLSQAGSIEKLSRAILLPYHLGRITTYVALAVLLSSILNVAFLFLPIRSLIIAPILMTAGLIFFVNAFPSLEKIFPWIGSIQLSAPYSWLATWFNRLSQGTGGGKQYLMGVLLGFMPCGMVVAALMAAATAPSALDAAMAMGAFGLGTMPALIIVALGGKAMNIKFPNVMQKITQGAMVVSGVWLFALAGLLFV